MKGRVHPKLEIQKFFYSQLFQEPRSCEYGSFYTLPEVAMLMSANMTVAPVSEAIVDTKNVVLTTLFQDKIDC